MMQKELLTKTLSQVGEEVGLELGTQMVKNYRESNPTDVKWYMVGREIIEKILAQPGCAALKFYNAYNEVGQKTLVYVGIDEAGKTIMEYSVVNTEGQLSKEKGIVADRIRIPNDDGIIGDDNIFAE